MDALHQLLLKAGLYMKRFCKKKTNSKIFWTKQEVGLGFGGFSNAWFTQQDNCADF